MTVSDCEEGVWSCCRDDREDSGKGTGRSVVAEAGIAAAVPAGAAAVLAGFVDVDTVGVDTAG